MTESSAGGNRVKRFISIAQGRELPGLRMVCFRKVPSPWTEAAKGIFHVKGLDCQYVAQSREDDADALVGWAGDTSAPVVALDNEPLKTGWAEILLLAERLEPLPSLIPQAPAQRARLFGLSHEICGEMGLGWCLRLEMIRKGLDHGDEGTSFPDDVNARLAAKYGFHPASVRAARQRVVEILGMLDDVLGEKPYFLGDSLSAVDVYWAAFANLLKPLGEAELPMSPVVREIYTSADQDFLSALTPRLIENRQRTYQEHLELPVPL